MLMVLYAGGGVSQGAGLLLPRVHDCIARLGWTVLPSALNIVAASAASHEGGVLGAVAALTISRSHAA